MESMFQVTTCGRHRVATLPLCLESSIVVAYMLPLHDSQIWYASVCTAGLPFLCILTLLTVFNQAAC